LKIGEVNTINRRKIITCFITFLTLLLILTACGVSTTEIETAPETVEQSEGNLNVHFLDVGQADCVLIQAPTGENMLIDAGNNADADTIVSYLNTQGVKKVDVLIGTHPHEDHIGSLDTVIDTFEIGKIYMPKVTHNTKTFQDVLIAIKNKGLKISTAFGGTSINFSPAMKVEMVAPNSSKYESLNNYSAVIKFTYGKTSFLFTGDAEEVSENEMLAQKYDLKADVLKVGHHGSSSSTTESFLKAVSPKYAVISVGKGNDYGHPHKEVLKRLLDGDICVLRTDELGTIIFTTDGENLRRR
jgi:competence protein ComEC